MRGIEHAVSACLRRLGASVGTCNPDIAGHLIFGVHEWPDLGVHRSWEAHESDDWISDARLLNGKDETPPDFI